MGSADKYGGVLLVSFAFADGCSFYAKTGANVSPRSGDCTIAGKPAEDDDGKSGLERGVYREDKRVVSEINWKNSKREGAGFYFDYNDRRIVAILKNDLAEGPVQVFFKENKLLCQMEFKEGKPQGAVGELFPSGKLEDAYEIRGDREGRGRIELLEDGTYIHYVVLGGGFDSVDGRWHQADLGFFLPVLAQSPSSRATFRDAMKLAGGLAEIDAQVWTVDWNVNCQPVRDA